ncbi:MAG: malonate decarboxylase subunit alpha, partial [Thermomicrobiales bacterium]|nr:malonate decarboxylase subunit alpha [Thermomicrobiales bacterium]
MTRLQTKTSTADDAVGAIASGSTIVVDSCGGGINEPSAVLAALERRFLETGEPRDLTLYLVSGMGDRRGGGADRFAHPGMVRRVVGSHWGWSPRLADMAVAGEFEAYVFPQGVLSHLLRDIAAGRPGVVTEVGLGTFVDPRVEGGRANARTPDGYVQLVELGGREWLFFPRIPIDVAIVRATTADERGNLTMEHEGMTLEVLSAAQAARNSGGTVIAQVKRLATTGSLDARRVHVPGNLVDAVVVAPEQQQTMHCAYDPALSGEVRVPQTSLSRAPLDARKVVARRAACELFPGAVVNLGYGIADGVASTAAEEGVLDTLTFTIEQGAVGGIPAMGDHFGLATNADAILDQPYQFDFFDGGGLDLTFLSFAELDICGNVNVSKFGGRLIGPGGFINMSQNARKAVFCGTFTSGGLDVAVENGRIRIIT